MRRKSAFAAVFKGRWRIAEMDMLASDDLDLADFPLQKQIAGTRSNRLGFSVARRVTVGELSEQLPAGASDKLRGSPSGRYEQG